MSVRGLRRFAAPAAVLGLAAALYAGSLAHGFAHDDTPLLLRNPFVRDPAHWMRLLRTDYWAPTLESGLYRPLASLSYALNFGLGGDRPLGFHAVNVALHAGVSALVWALVRRLTGDPSLALVTGLLFAAHAVHTEVVANVTAGRPELLAATFLLLSLHAHLAAEGASRARARRRRGWAVACFALALLCKESAVAWLGVVWLTDALYREGAERPSLAAFGRALGRRGATLYAAYGVAVLAWLGVRLLALGADAGLPPPRVLDNPLVGLPVGWRLANAVGVLIRYAELLVLPLRLSYDYSYDQIPLFARAGPELLRVLAALAAGAALAALAFRRSRDAFWGLAFCGLAIAVVANLAFPIGTILGERLLYLPSVGFCLLLALALRRLAGGRQRLFAALAAGAVALHGARALERVPDWRSEDAIWLHDVERVPRSARAQSNAGAVLERQGRCEEALPRFDAAIAIGLPPHEFVHPYRGKAVCLAALGRYAEAETLYRIAARHGEPHPELERRIREGLRRAGVAGPAATATDVP